MYFLFDACYDPEVLRVILFFNMILDIVFTIIPIGLILMLMIDFSKAVIASKEEEQVKSTKLVGKRILYAILVFMVQFIVNTILIILDEVEVLEEYTACRKNATQDQITYWQDIKDEKEKAEKEAQRQKWEEERQNSEEEVPETKSVAHGSTYASAADEMLKLARGELGNGGTKYSGDPADSTAWCSYFVVWNLKHTTVGDGSTVFDIITSEGMPTNSLGFAGSLTENFFYHSNLSFIESKYYDSSSKYSPKKGDIIFFWYQNIKGRRWDGTAYDATFASHVGLVDYTANGRVYTIEGNVGGKVVKEDYPLDDPGILGYGSWYNISRFPNKPGGNSGNTVDIY